MTPRVIVRVVRVGAVLGILCAVVGSVWIVMLTGAASWWSELMAFLALFALAFSTIAWLAVPQQHGNAVVWTMASSGFFCGVYLAGLAAAAATVDDPMVIVSAPESIVPAMYPGAALILLIVEPALVGSLFPLMTFGLLLFPDGRLPSPRWRWVGWFAGASIALVTVLFAWGFRRGSTAPADSGVLLDSSWTPLLLSVLLCLAGMVVRFRRSDGATRAQFKWIVWGAAFFAPTLVVAVTLGGTRHEGLAFVPLTVAGAVFVGAYGVAVTRHHLYDIDVVISKTVTYLGLAGAVTALYAGVVVAPVLILGASEEGRGTGLVLPIVATAIVAIAFEPLRASLQGWANRLVYGERATPHELLSDVTARLSEVSDAEASLSGLANLLRQGTGAERASVWLDVGGTIRPEAASPREHLNELRKTPAVDDGTHTLTVPVVHAGETLGALRIDKSRNDPVTPADQQLLDDVAAAAGLRLRNLRLQAALAERADELRASRRRLIAAHDAARHRLERDLHDGAQQQVVALKVKLGLARSIADREGAHEVAAAIERLAEGTQEAVDDMRLLARGIYPPLLEAEGLAPTLAGLDRHAAVPVTVTAENLARYPRPVEETVYFCSAALVSIGAMAGATAVELFVSGEEGLQMAARFIGASGAIDLGSLSDRVDALGGRIDTPGGAVADRVLVTLPIQSLEPA